MSAPSARRSRSAGGRLRAALRAVPARVVFDYLILAWFTVATMTPIVWLIASSFKTNAQILSASGFFPSEINWQGYVDAFTTTNLPLYFFNSFVVSASATLLVLAVATMAAYPLARFDVPAGGFLTTVFSLGIVVPVTSLLVPETIVMRTLGLYDSRIGLIVLYAALYFSISFLVLRAYFLSLPREIEEAAMVDGAGYWTILTRVVLPLSGPGLSTVAVIVFIFTWNEFLYALLVLTSADKRTVQIAIKFFTSQFDFNLPGMFATITLVMIVPIAVFLVMQERVIEGLTAGATKG